MRRYTPDQFAARIAPDRIRAEVERRFRRILPAVRRAVAGDAVANRMRDAKGEPVRRDPDDAGPLRITSRAESDGPVRYAKAVRGGVPGSIDRVEQAAPLRVTYSMGVDLDAVPQGYNEERYPTFTASIKARARELRRMVREEFVSGLRSLVR